MQGKGLLHHYLHRFRNNLRSNSWGRTAEKTPQCQEGSEPTAGLQGWSRAEDSRPLGTEGSCRSKEGAALRWCSTRRLIKTEVWTPGVRPHFGTRRVTYKETYTYK